MDADNDYYESMELKLETPAEVANVDIEQLVPWGLTEDQYALLGLLCLEQSGMSKTALDKLRDQLFNRDTDG